MTVKAKAPSSVPSLLTMLKTQLMMFIMVLVGVTSAMIVMVYDWGSDDMLHYVMTIEAEGYDSEPFDSSDSAYPIYIEPPPLWRQLFSLKELQEGQLHSITQNQKTYFILRYETSDSTPIYVTHTYDAALDQHDLGIGLYQLIGGIGVITVITSLWLAYRIRRKILQPIDQLTLLSEQLPDQLTQSKKGSGSDLKLGFSENTEHNEIFEIREFRQLAEHMQNKQRQLLALTKKEQEFLSALSHELRTPLAISQTALDLLDRNVSNRTESDNRKLEKLKRAHKNMRETSDTILWLWSAQNTALTEKCDVDLHALCERIIHQNQHLIALKPVDITINSRQNKHHIQPVAGEIVLRNLIRNAMQYSMKGEIRIVLSASGILVSNETGSSNRETEQKGNGSQSQMKDYGFGVGLFLVEKVCEKLEWRLSTENQSDRFSVEVRFKRRVDW